MISYVSPSNDRCLIYRSPLSVDTIHYRQVEDGVLWHSDPLALLGDEETADVDLDVLCARVMMFPVLPGRSVFAGLRQLPPGHLLELGTSIGLREIADLKRGEDNRGMSVPEAADRYRALARRSVVDACSGVDKVGVLLSGGVDSARIACEAARVADVTAFHFTLRGLPGFQEELQAAKSVASFAGIPLEIVDVGPLIEQGGKLLELSGVRTAPYLRVFFRPFEAIAQHAGGFGIDRMLSGLFADELFVGHHTDPVYAALRLATTERSVWPLIDVLGILRGDLVPFGLKLLRRRSTSFESARIRDIDAYVGTAVTDVCKQRAAAVADSSQEVAFSSVSSSAVHHGILRTLNSEGDIESALRYDIWYPQGMSWAHPFADPALARFALSLGPEHRSLAESGQRIEKVAWRYGALSDLPNGVASRSLRAPYSGLAELYCRYNRSSVISRLGPASILAALGVIDAEVVRVGVGSGTLLRGGAPGIIALLGAEAWLQTIGYGGSGAGTGASGRDWGRPLSRGSSTEAGGLIGQP